MHSLARLLARSALVVKDARIDESAEVQVSILARKSGVISWILSLLGIDSTFALRVYRDRIESEEGSLSGRIKTVIPLTSLDTYTSGFTKPFILVILAVVFFVAAVSCLAGEDGSGILVFILLMAAIGCIIGFYLMKCLILNFTTKGANGILFLFKRSVIEGVNVDQAFSDRVADLVKKNYIEQVRK